MCGYHYTEKLPNTGVLSYVASYFILFLLELHFIPITFCSGWRGNQKEELCSVQIVQKKRRQDDTTSANKKLWKSCLPKFKLNLKRRRKVEIMIANTSINID